MTDPSDTGFLTKLLAGVSTALVAVGTWAWTHTHKRIDSKAEASTVDALSSRVENHTISKDVFEEHVKADVRQFEQFGVELATQRSNIDKLFEKMDESNSETQVRFTKSDHDAHARHVDLLNAIHALKK